MAMQIAESLGEKKGKEYNYSDTADQFMLRPLCP